MDCKRTKATSSSSSSSFDNLFGPKGSVSASSASSCSTILDSIFPPPVARQQGTYTAPEVQGNISQATDERNSHEKREASYFSSSIYYRGQQHYSPPRIDGSTTSLSHQSNEANDRTDTTTSASRGNWWKGSLYY